MPLSLRLLTRPASVARVVALAGLAALLAGAIALDGHALAPVATLAALLSTGVVLGVLSPLYGRTAAAGLWSARAGVALGGGAALLPGGSPMVAVRVFAAILVVVGLGTIARRAQGLSDLPPWTTAVVAVGTVAALLVPALGGGLLLALAWLAVATTIHATSAVPGAAPARA